MLGSFEAFCIYLAKVLLWSSLINTGVPACTGLDPSSGSV